MAHDGRKGLAFYTIMKFQTMQRERNYFYSLGNMKKKRDAFSCTLLNTALEKAVGYSRTETKGILYNKSTQILVYADDVVTVGRSIDELKKDRRQKTVK